jgi:DNA-binding winged helix-turn-helix (wHTH) protein
MLIRMVGGGSSDATTAMAPRPNTENVRASNKIVLPANLGSLGMNNRESPLKVRFGRFVLDSHRCELLADGVPVPIGGRAFEILVVLVEAAGQLVTKDELLSRVWPGRFVEENSLQFHISALRKALGPDREFIKTIAGRGYRFIAHIAADPGPDAAMAARHGASSASTEFPAAMSDLISTRAKLSGLAELITAYRLGALVGGSGSGRTHPDLEFGRRLLSQFAGGAWCGEPGPSTTGNLGLPAALPLGMDGADTLEGLAASCALERLLLLLSIVVLTVPAQDSEVFTTGNFARGSIQPHSRLASPATSNPRCATYVVMRPTGSRTRGRDRPVHRPTTWGKNSRYCVRISPLLGEGRVDPPATGP